MTDSQKSTARKSVRLDVRLDEEQKQRVAQAAAMMGQTVSAFACSVLVDRADQIFKQEEYKDRQRTAAEDEN